MTEKELRNMGLDIDQIIDKLPIYPKFTKEQMISEAKFFYDGGNDVFADKIEQTVQKYPDAKVFVHFKGYFYPISTIDDIVNIPGLLNRLEWRIEMDYCEDNENYSDSE